MPSKKLNQPSKSLSKSKSSSTDSPWIKCPRPRCLMLYQPKNAHRHLKTCRYFCCSNEHCNFQGNQKQIHEHESGCPYGLRSEEIGTTDPLSDSPSEVLDILTSPNRVHSYPTDPSSGVSPASSHKKRGSARQHVFNSHPLNFCDGSPIQSSSKLTEPIIPPSDATITRFRRRQQSRRSTIDPYDPSAKRIFSLPADSINPDLRPAPPPVSKCSSPVPPPPTRRLGTYELQRYRPEPQSIRPPTPLTDTKQSSDCQDVEDPCVALATKTAQLEAVQECYSALLKSFDDIAYSISQNRSSHQLQEAIARVPLEEFDRVLEHVSQGVVPDSSFLEDIRPNEDDAKDEKKKENKEKRQRSCSKLTRQNSCERSSAGYDPQQPLTTDELSEQVRLKIAGSEIKSSPLADSPSNIFGRKRKRPSEPLREPQRATKFIHKLADTTIDLADEIQPGLPSCCNFNKLFQIAGSRIQTRLELRNQRLESP